MKVLPLLAAVFVAQLNAGESAGVDAVTAGAKKAVAFLLSQQNENGSFGKSGGAQQPGMVGLVVKALADSPEHLREQNPALAKAAGRIVEFAQPNGAIGDPKLGLENYNTSIAVIGLAALENPQYKPILENARKYILSCQQDEETGVKRDESPVTYGGFAYGSTKRADVSNSGFSMEALHALGLEKDSPAWKNAVAFLKRSQDFDETNDYATMKGGENSGGFVYYPGKSAFGEITTRAGKKLPKPYGNMTYVAVKSLLYAGVQKDDPALQAAFKWIRNNYAVDHQPGGTGTVGYYYYVMAFAKAFTAAGTVELDLPDGRKVNWASDLSTELLKLQKPDGSFSNEAQRWMESDPVVSTSYALQALNLCVDALKK
jgi:squalene-hopene/tetraprenyl-beta-curcumene cyclase